jgi:hypothetical protein
MENTVALAAIALAATTVAGLVWVVKYLAKTLTVGLKEHSAAAHDQAKASKEVLKFMKNLNGKLENAYIEKAKE